MIRKVAQNVLHISEAELERDLHSILRRVQMGTEVIVEGKSQPPVVMRAANPPNRTIAECIALAKAHEQKTGSAPTPDPDFASDIEEIVKNRQPWDPPGWD